MGTQYSCTAELLTILMALYEIDNLIGKIVNVTFCVDSQSVLQSLQSINIKERADFIYEIKHLINSFIENGTDIYFLWIPSHCNFRYNDIADRAAKCGAKNENAIKIDITLSKNEKYAIIEKLFKNNLVNRNKLIPVNTSRQMSNVARRIKLNSLKTKYISNITCKCSKQFSLNHILKECVEYKALIPEIHNRDPSELDIIECIKVAKILSETEIFEYL